MNKFDFLSKEEQIVVLASRLTFSEYEEQQLEFLKTQQLNWIEIFRMSIKNKVLPLIWSNLTKRGYKSKGIVPTRLQQVIDFHSIGTKERNVAYLNELDKVADAMQQNNVSCIPVKGGYLIRNMYQNLGIRTVNDLDCLISRRDVSRVREVMSSLGYVEGDYDSVKGEIVPPSREKMMLWKTKMYNLYPFRKKFDSEFARVITFDFSFSMDLDIKTEPVDLMIGRSMNKNNDLHYYLKPSDFFIHQCCHHYREAFNASWVLLDSDLNLIKFCDVREYVLSKMTQADLNEAIAFAIQFGFEKAVYFTLYYLNEIYGDGYEEDLLKQLHIQDTSFLDSFGEKDFGYNVKWKKNFWQRLFAESNKDEIVEKTKYAGIVDIR